MGEYISNLGALGSFLCDPFKLDIQIALSLQYQRSRIDQPAPTCTLAGVINNIEGFLDGAQGSFSEGGWDDWFDITAKPETYTPYGAALAAETGAHIRILNAKGEAAAKLEWGAGFLSGEICKVVSGPGGDTEECDITKPGKIIEEALSFNLDSGRQSLVTADEIDEVIGALISQLANKALTGAAGLLGLSGGTGYTYTGFTGGSYTAAMTAESLGIATNSGLAEFEKARDFEIAYRDLAIGKKATLEAIAASTSASASTVAAANTALTEVNAVISATTLNLLNLNSIISEYTAASSAAEKDAILDKYQTLPLHSEGQYAVSESSWNLVISAANAAAVSVASPGPDPVVVKMESDLQIQMDYRVLALNYKPQLEAYASATTTLPADAAAASAAASDAQIIISNATADITDLSDIINNYKAATSDALRALYVSDYEDLSLYRQSDLNSSKAAWDAILP
jgi:hypothetical protein